MADRSKGIFNHTRLNRISKMIIFLFWKKVSICELFVRYEDRFICIPTIKCIWYFLDVPILHIIPMPFPPFWHKSGDNRHNIDLKTTENINRILRIFVASYLHLSIV